MMDMCHYNLFKPIECTTPGVNHNINYELGVIMMCQHRFLGCSKCTTQIGNVNKGVGYVCVEAGGCMGNLCTFPLILL